MDIIAVLTDEHDQMKVGLTDLMDTDSPRRRERVFAALVGMMKRHSAFEQAHVYVLLSARRRAALAFQAQAEHQQLAFWLEELDRMPSDDPHWLAQVGVLAGDLAEHLRMEEERLFPLLRSLVGRSELEGLGRAYAERKDGAARRGHHLAVAG